MNSVGVQKAPANLAWAQQCRPGTWHPKETTWERWGGGQIPSGVKGAALSVRGVSASSRSPLAVGDEPSRFPWD